LNRLLNAFKTLGNKSKWDEKFCLKTNLCERIKFYFGPPGTGKTTRVAEEIIKRMENGAELKILVLTPTNKSADVLSEKILTYSNSQCAWLIRWSVF
jgi:replication-associated recombination protein RarA